MAKQAAKRIRAAHNRKSKQIIFASVGVAIDASGELPKCHIVAYTGGKLEWDYKEFAMVADLSDAKFAAASIPLLYNHWDEDRIGHTTSNTIENNQVILEGVVSGTSENAYRVAQESRNGFPWQASIGARYDRVEFYDEGQFVVVNGQTFNGPIEVARGVTIFETSFVVFGADGNTDSQVFAKRKIKGGKPMTFSEWLAQLGYDEATITDDVREALQKAFDSANIDAAADDENSDSTDDEEKKKEEDELDAADDSTDDEEKENKDVSASRGVNRNREQLRAYRKQIAAENSRIEKIRKLCAGRHPQLEAKAIEGGWSPVVVENRVLKADAKQNRQDVPKTYNGASSQSLGGVLEASALIASGLKPKQLEAVGYDQKTLDQAESVAWRGAGIQRIIAVTYESAGHHLPAGIGGAAFYAAANDVHRKIRAAGGIGSFSTVSLPGILSNIANKALLTGYQSRESTLMKIATRSNHRDFKGMTEYRLEMSGRMKKVGPGGKIESASMQEQGYSNKVETDAVLISLTRDMIINDDLSALTSIPTQMGQLAFDTREAEGWETFLSSVATFFTAGRGNRINEPLGIEGLAMAEQFMAEQKNANGLPISVSGRYLIVPPRLHPLARTLYTSMTVNESTTIDTPRPVDNPYTNLYEPIMVPHLGATHKNGSNAHWMMIADPNQIPLINVAFLNGQENPTIEESDSSFDTLGYQYRIYIDFGIAMFDYRGGIYSDGTGTP